MDKTINQKAWFLVLPVFLVVAFSAVLPLMTVVNYSMQDTFGNNQFFWNGVGWFKELLDPSTDLGGRFFASLWRNLFFSGVILAIEVPLGIVDRAVDAARRLDGRGLPRHPRVAAADSVERGRHDLADLWPARHRPARLCAEQHRHQLQLRLQRHRRLGHRHRHGRLALDQPGRAALLCRPEVDPRCLLSGRANRRRLALGGVHRDPAAEDEPRAADRGAAALHGQLHDLHRAVRRHRRRARQLDHLHLDRAGQDRARPVRPRQGGGAVAGLQPHHPDRVLGVLHRHDQCRRRASRKEGVA